MSLRFVLISDTHTREKKIKLPPGDVLLHAGDFSGTGKIWEVVHFLKWFDQQDFKYKCFCAGNHDGLAQLDPSTFSSLCQQYLKPNCYYLQDSVCEIAGLKIFGSPQTQKFYSWFFMKEPGPEMARIWSLIPDDVDIIMTHSPVYGYGDLARLEKSPNQLGHVGCPELLNRIDQLKNLKLSVFGHIHSGNGIYHRNSVTLVNASVLDDDYKVAYQPIVLDFDGKEFKCPQE